MDKHLLIINAGSSSIKFTVYQIEATGILTKNIGGLIEGIGNTPVFKIIDQNGELLTDSLLNEAEQKTHTDFLNIINTWLRDYYDNGEFLAIGHRVVHGGISYSSPVLVNDKVLADLAKLIPLAPLHQPHNLSAIRAFRELMPGLPQVACFDTAFHQSQPEVAQCTGLPKRFFDAGIRRYGFHGLSFEYIASRLPVLLPEQSNTKVIVAHLGNGASLCALKNGRSIATTMGFSPLDGLLMGTRCGSLDPGAILYLLDHYEMNNRRLEHLLYYESGLLGISGISSDMRALLASNEAKAISAIDLFVYRIVREIGSLTAALGGLDAIVFTGGIGENAIRIRDMICRQSAWLGIEIEPEENKISAAVISNQNSDIRVLIIPTDENLMIARHTWRIVTKS